MFEVVPQPLFSAWQQALPAPLAEEVSAALTLVASAGATFGPERLSRLLLWYDGARGAEQDLSANALRDYAAWQDEVVRCLGSAAFRASQQRIEPARNDLALSLRELVERRLLAARASASSDARVLLAERPAGGDTSSEWRELREAFMSLLSVLGLESRLLAGSGSELRELLITRAQPAIRVLFGLDFSTKRLIVILGEPLDRQYHGDSVQLAEGHWLDYLQHGSPGPEVTATP